MEKRLQSLKRPRDLTLGGTKPPKKAYVPNLNVVRNKEKSKEFLKKSEVVKKDKRNKKVNSRPRENGHCVQSSGVFSQGSGADLVRKAYVKSERSYNGRDDVPVAMAVPTVKKDSWEVNMQVEENVFEDIMRRGFESDDDEKLPFTPIAWNESDLKKSRVAEVKREIKSESTTVNGTVNANGTENTNGTTATNIAEPSLKSKLMNGLEGTLPSEYQDTETPSDHRPVLTMWNLPISFSAKGLSDDPNDKKISDYKLKNMLEGQIGKIVVRKSGRMEVCVGNMKYNLVPTRSSHEPIYSTEELVTFEERENGSSTSSVLGEIQNNFMLTPDWQHLLSADN